VNKLVTEEIGIVGFGEAEEVTEIVGFAKIFVVVFVVVLVDVTMKIQNFR